MVSDCCFFPAHFQNVALNVGEINKYKNIWLAFEEINLYNTYNFTFNSNLNSSNILKDNSFLIVYIDETK